MHYSLPCMPFRTVMRIGATRITTFASTSLTLRVHPTATQSLQHPTTWMKQPGTASRALHLAIPICWRGVLMIFGEILFALSYFRTLPLVLLLDV